MTKTSAYIDCCAAPKLETIHTFLSPETMIIAIKCCQDCGTQWFYLLREDLCELESFSDEVTEKDYDQHKWYVRLAPDEAKKLLSSATAPDQRLFAGRPGFLRDANGMNPIVGVPDFIC